MGTKKEKDEEERGGHFYRRIVGQFWVVVFWPVLTTFSAEEKTCPVFYRPDSFRRSFVQIVLFVGIGHAASLTLTSLFCVRKNEFEHSRHSGDKCLPEYDVRANEDFVRISRKHRGT